MLVARPRIAAVDYGTRRVGLAVTDPLHLFARPLGTYGPSEALDQLVRLHAEEGVEAVVVGWPLTPDGAEAEAVGRVRPFIGRLKKALPDVRVELQDERDTSRRAVSALVEAGVGKKARREKGRVDAAAAVLILQDWLGEREGNG